MDRTPAPEGTTPDSNVGAAPTADDATLEAVLFDMDGVFLVGPHTPAAVYADAADAALDDLEPATEPTDEHRTVLGRYGYADALETTCEELGVDPRAFWRHKERHACRLSHERIRSGERDLYDDADAVASLVADRPSALVSNNRQATVEFVADHLDLAFDARRGRAPTPEGYRRRKPEPDFLVETMAELGVDGGVYVGDSPKDVVAATRAGLDAAFLRRPHNEGVTLPDGAAYDLASLADLPPVLESD